MGRVSAISKVSPSRFRSATQAGNLLGGSLLGGSFLLGTVTGQRNDAAAPGFWVWARLGVRLNPTNTDNRKKRDARNFMYPPIHSLGARHHSFTGEMAAGATKLILKSTFHSIPANFTVALVPCVSSSQVPRFLIPGSFNMFRFDLVRRTV
jgi:hypothetical protein